MPQIANASKWMSRALELAAQGCGHVEPNPMVGCVIVQRDQIVGEGWHQRFGSPHAEIEALKAAGDAANGATAYVTLEPCCHQGKTGPCTQALIKAGIERVVVGCSDPNPAVSGKGISELREAGIDVLENVEHQKATSLIAPFAKLVTQGLPWVIAKWAMTLDGKLATHTGSSQWISGEASRAVVHKVRGVVDAILVGRGTAESDDPLLTARPAGPRTALRIVLDSSASLSPTSRLAQSATAASLLVAVTESAPAQRCQRLQELGAEVFVLTGDDHPAQMQSLLAELGRRKLTNLLVEGGAKVFGTLLDMCAIDEVHAFIAPKLIGGQSAPTAIGGQGIAVMGDALLLQNAEVNILDGDVHVHGRIDHCLPTIHLER